MIVGRPQVGAGGQLGIGTDGVRDVLGPLAGVQALAHCIHEHAEIARGVREHLPHRRLALHHEPVSGKEPLGPELRHHLQRVGPVLGVALHLLRVPAVGRLPDDEIAGEEVAVLGHPDPERVVGLAACRVQLQSRVAHRNRVLLAHVACRPAEAAREDGLGQAELPLVDAGVQPVQLAVAAKARGAVLLGHDLGLLAGGEKGPEPERVVGVPVRVHGDCQRRVAPGADGAPEPVARLAESRIDERETGGRAKRVRVDEDRMHEDVRRHLAGLAEEARLGRQRIAGDHRGRHGRPVAVEPRHAPQSSRMGRGAGIARVLASRWWLAGVLVAGAGLRVAHVLALRDSPWFEHLVVDPQYYDAWAQRIAAGDWLGDRAFYMDPLYPYVLGALYGLAGRDLLLARLVNVAFSTGACLFVARIGAVAGGRPVGGLAALGYALYQPEIFYTGEVDKTSLSMLLGAAALALFLSRAPAARFASGAAVAAAALTRANFLSFVPLGAVACLAYSRRPDERRLGGIREAALFLAGAALVLAPVAWRNHHVSGAWVVTTTQMGQNFYTGNNPTNPYGAYGAVPFVRPNPHFEEADFRAEAEARTKRTMSPAEVSAYWLRAALSHIGSAPGFALAAFGRK